MAVRALFAACAALASPGVALPSDGLYRRLVKWIRENDGFVSDKVEVKRVGGMNGIMAAGPIQEKEVVFSIPIKLHTGIELTNPHSPLLRAVSGIKELQLPYASLVAHIVRETELSEKRRAAELRGETLDPRPDDGATSRSFWAPWWDTVDLNQTLSMPYWRATEEFEAMKSSPEVFTVKEPANWTLHDHTLIVNTFFSSCPPATSHWCTAETGDFALDRFRMASLYWSTRTFTARGTMHHVVPIAEYLNHDTDEFANCFWKWNDEHDTLEVTAQKNISEGTELTQSYGLRSNAQLLATYGFTITPIKEPIYTWRIWTHLMREWETNDVFLQGLGVDVRLMTLKRDLKKNDQEKADTLIGLKKIVTAATVGKRGDPSTVVREVIDHYVGIYEGDKALEPHIARLRRNRERDPKEFVWWREPDDPQDTDVTAGGGFGNDGQRVAVGEYLCLLAHQEMLALRRGDKKPDQVASQAVALLAPFELVIADGILAAPPAPVSPARPEL